MVTTPRRIPTFERYLSVWVALCMLLGITLGRFLPEWTARLRSLELGAGSKINVPIAILIWLMIYPMMLKIDFGSIAAGRPAAAGLLVTLVVNWLVKPFSMASARVALFPERVSARLSRRDWRASTPRASSFSPPRLARRWSSSGAI